MIGIENFLVFLQNEVLSLSNSLSDRYKSIYIPNFYLSLNNYENDKTIYKISIKNSNKKHCTMVLPFSDEKSYKTQDLLTAMVSLMEKFYT